LNIMNDYGCDGKHFADGVDRVGYMCKQTFYNAKFANYTKNAEGEMVGNVFTAGKAPEDYSTSIVGNYSLAWIKEVVSQGPDHKPFFAFVGPHAPHLPSTPPPYSVDPAIDKIEVPKTPDYGILAKDKHAFLPHEPDINSADSAAIEVEHTNRLKSLVAVDIILAQIERYLKSVGEWDNTYLFYTSDHGYNLGQFRVDSHKTQVYDHNSRVPMIIKGPGVTKGSVLPLVTSMVDLGPTILELAAGRKSDTTKTMDGSSFAPMLLGKEARPWKGAALIEYRSIREQNTEEMCKDGPLTAEEVDEYVSAYGYSIDSELDSFGRPKLCSSPLLSTHWMTAPRSPAHKQHHHHDGPRNTFAALRVIDHQNDLLYAEFVNVNNPLAWDFDVEQVYFRELYNVSQDFYMINNIVDAVPEDFRQELSKRLHAALSCKGHDECVKSLGQKSGRDTLYMV